MNLLEPELLATSAREAVAKLHPRELVKKPVLFVVAVGSVLTTLSALIHPSVFTWVISVWLWLTVLFANLAEAVAEGRGRAQAESLRKARTDTVALRLNHWTYGANLRHAETEVVTPAELQPFDFVLVEAAKRSRPTATSSTAPRWWTSPPSPANRPRSCGSRAATGPR